LASRRLGFCSALAVEKAAVIPRSDGGNPGTPFGSGEHQQFAQRFLCRASRRAAHRSAHQSFGYRVGGDRVGEKLACPRAHAADQHLRIVSRRINHHRRGAVATDIFHQIQSLFRIAVQLNDNDVILSLEQPRHVVQVRIRRELPCHVRLRPSQSSGYYLAALFLRANQCNRQHVGAKRVRILSKRRHHDFSTSCRLQRSRRFI
jgi:hypothetical protein